MKNVLKSISALALLVSIISGLLFLLILVFQEKPDWCYSLNNIAEGEKCWMEITNEHANERKPYWITFLISGSVFYLARQFAQVYEDDNKEKSNL